MNTITNSIRLKICL